MKPFKQVKYLKLFFSYKKSKVQLGILAIKNRKIYFEYDPDFLKLNLNLSPFKLPYKPGVLTCKEEVFEGLFGVFNDSLPDGWGRLLIDRKLKSLGIAPERISPLDRLSFVGGKGMGAISYEPNVDSSEFREKIDLDEIARQCFTILKTNEDIFIDNLLALNGSSAGARPKIIFNSLQKNTKSKNIEKIESWLIKFQSNYDSKDIGAIEFAYNLMAKEAGLEIPDVKLFKSRNNPGFFGSKRFDLKNNKRIHMHSLSGLLHIDHKLPCLDYKTILKATSLLTKDIKETLKMFRLSVFNIFAHNRDDHAKNFSFLMDDEGVWRVSPAYDLTFSYGPGGEHCTTIMGEGKNPQKSHLIKLAESIGIKEKQAKQIIEEVISGVSQWKKFAKNSGVALKNIELINNALKKLL